MSSTKSARYVSLLLWTAYLLYPTDAGGLVNGIPLGPIDITALLVLGWLALFGESLRGAWLAGVVLVVSAAAAAAVPGTGGFRARYFANAEATGVHERSTEYPDSAFTRVDRRLSFGLDGKEFPLPFFNDNSRFNFYRNDEPHRRRLPFAVSWSGLWMTAGGSQHLYLNAPEATAELFLDGASVLSATPGGGLASREITLAGGWHRLDVRFSSPYASPRQFAAGVISDGGYHPFAATTVATQQIRPWQLQAAQVLRVAKTAADAVALAWLAWLFAIAVRTRVATLWQGDSAVSLRHRVAPLVAIVASIEALIFAWPWSRQTLLLAGGDDPMTYEGYARDILLNGILMNGGLPPGQGEPFYYQAFYPYFLAAVHAVTGEGAFGILLIQRLLAALTIWMLVELTIALSSEAVWGVALAVATFFVCWKFWPLASNLLSESLYVPLLVAWTASMVRTCRAPTLKRGLASGLLGGFAAITRSTALLTWPLVLASCWFSWKGVARRGTILAVLIASSVGVFSLIAIRNAIVAHEFAATSTELGITLLGGNEIPPEVVIDLTTRAPLYASLGIGELTAQVIEYALTAPGLFIANLGRKALFALGFYEPYAPGWGYSPVYIAVWAVALAGLALSLRAEPAAAGAILIPALIAVAQFTAVVIIYPKGERLILPIHVVLVPYAAIALWCAARPLRRLLRS